MDALSYIQLFPHDREGIFVSFCGGLGSGFKQQLPTLLKKLDISQVVICMDNDAAGYKFADELESIIFGCDVFKRFPQKKDWNDDLIYSQTAPKN